MSDLLTYSYSQPSSLVSGTSGSSLFLAQYSEIQKDNAPCFFWGKLTEPYLLSRCLVALSSVVKSSFSLSPADFAKMKDPIVTAGNDRIRFEGFSFCAGVYARVDVLPDGFDGEFPAQGTTNVDFNQPMISALNSIQRGSNMSLSVGKKEVTVTTGANKIVERKVPLPTKWIKGLTSVQVFLADTEITHRFNRIQTLQLFQSIPGGKPKNDYYLTIRGNKPIFSAVKSTNAICVGGVHRLKLLEPLLPLADALHVFAHPQMQSTTWQLYMGPIRFCMSVSRDAWRGFSGEGAALEAMLDNIEDSWIDAMDKYSYANQTFNPTMIAVNEQLDIQQVDSIAARLSAMGLLGYDLDDNAFFYRRLPFKLGRILSLNPRLKEAEALLAAGKLRVISQTNERIEAAVAGTEVEHTVVIANGQARCTCTWFGKHQGERGVCKHILAVKKFTKTIDND